MNHSRGLAGASKTWGMNMAALTEARPWWEAPRKMMKTMRRSSLTWAARLIMRRIRLPAVGALVGSMGSFMV